MIGIGDHPPILFDAFGGCDVFVPHYVNGEDLKRE